MITGKINFLQLKCSRKMMKGKTGEMECLVIPIALNNLFVGEKGIYLDLIAFEIKNKKGESKDTHLIKQSLPKEIREAMSQEEQNATPILGGMRIDDNSGYAEKDPVSSTDVSNEVDDLPF